LQWEYKFKTTIQEHSHNLVFFGFVFSLCAFIFICTSASEEAAEAEQSMQLKATSENKSDAITF